MDIVTFRVQVKSISKWTSYIVRQYALVDVVYFKLAIDARCHWNEDGYVCLSHAIIFLGMCNFSTNKREALSMPQNQPMLFLYILVPNNPKQIEYSIIYGIVLMA